LRSISNRRLKQEVNVVAQQSDKLKHPYYNSCTKLYNTKIRNVVVSITRTMT
jgi:hypothetical protein